MTLSAKDIEARKRRIGSTDIAALVAFYRPELAHLAKKKNACDVWLRLVHGIDQPHRAVMGRGNRVEPILRELYRETIGPASEPPGVIQHPKYDWACASPDGLSDVVQEFKTASEWIRDRWGEPGTDLVPDDYNLQTQWLLEVTGREIAHVLVAFGRDFKDDDGKPDFLITETAAYFVRRDETLAAAMVECGQRFFAEHVATRVPPGIAPLHNKRRFKALEKERNGKATGNSGRDGERDGERDDEGDAVGLGPTDY